MNLFLRKKLILGTAQLLNKYGLVKNKKSSEKQIYKFLDYIISDGVRKIDTAPAYNSEIYLGNFIDRNNIKNLKISTKIPSLRKYQYNKKIEFIKRSLNKSLDRIKHKIDTVYFHDPEDKLFLYKNCEKVCKIFNDFNIKNLGISIYDYKDIKIINKIENPISLQFPLNIFNNSFLKIKFKKSNKYFARSIFLQGLLLNKKINKKIPKQTKNIQKLYFDFLENKKITAIDYNLSFVLKNKDINGLIIGFDNIMQYKQLNDYKSINFFDMPKKILKLVKKKDFDPRYW